MIREALPADGDSLARIYNHYIEHTTLTFEETPLTGAQMAERVLDIQASYPWLVLEVDHQVVGYCYSRRWNGRAAYRHSVELSIFLDPTLQGRGHGTRLYNELFDRLQQLHVHVMIGGIALPNEPSVALHERFGFEKVAHFSEVGHKFGGWVDVGYWQRTFTNSTGHA